MVAKHGKMRKMDSWNLVSLKQTRPEIIHFSIQTPGSNN
jgi:hypothetical protein